MKTMGLRTVAADFNDERAIRDVVTAYGGGFGAVLVQHTRQQPQDRYDFAGVVRSLKSLMPRVPVVTDDNYAVLKVPEIGCQAGAEVSAFSCFKVLWPEGVGALVGGREYIDRVAKLQYSGGSQVQGHEAMAALRGIIYAPVALAIQSQVGNTLVERLNGGELPEVKRAFLANAQSKVLLVEFRGDIADALLRITPKHGAAARPVGSESKYEFAPMIYRISGTFRDADPEMEKRMIRVNPMRSGPDTVIRILRESLDELKGETSCS